MGFNPELFSSKIFVYFSRVFHLHHEGLASYCRGSYNIQVLEEINTSLAQKTLLLLWTIPWDPRLGQTAGINTLLPHICPVASFPSPQHKHFHSLHSSTLGNHPRGIMRAKSRDLANVQNARRIVDLSLIPCALASSSGKQNSLLALPSLPS